MSTQQDTQLRRAIELSEAQTQLECEERFRQDQEALEEAVKLSLRDRGVDSASAGPWPVARADGRAVAGAGQAGMAQAPARRQDQPLLSRGISGQKIGWLPADSMAKELVGTWSDWCNEDGTAADPPRYCVTITPLLEGGTALGIHIVLLSSGQLVSQQVGRAVEGGLVIEDGEEAWRGMQARLVFGLTPTLAWDNQSKWKKASHQPSELYTRHHGQFCPPPPPPAQDLGPGQARPQPQLAAAARPQQPGPGLARQLSEGGSDTANTSAASAAQSSAAFLRTVMASRRADGAPAWLPPSTPVEDVPGFGACLFHAIAQSSDASTARSLRHLTVDWVRAHWTENPDVLPLLGPAQRALLQSLPLQQAIAREYRGITISTIDMYVQHMMRDDAYAEDVEAAIAAKILGVELSIYVPAIGSGTGGWLCEAPQMGEAGGSPRAVALIDRDQAWASHYQILRA